MERQATDIVVFGGQGDLAMRKLMPALYYLHCHQELGEGTRIIATSRSALSREQYIASLRQTSPDYISGEEFDPDSFEAFCERVDYVSLDAQERSHYSRLGAALRLNDVPSLYYFATPPSLFGPLAENLARQKLVQPNSRLVLEKPLGHDAESANAVNEKVGQYFEESAIYRIDHYLGKEAVQNLLVLRFANSIFERVWSREFIDHIQITLSEDIGVGRRWAYYNQAGALRDMVQNHLLQLLCLVAMEPPSEFTKDSIRDEKLKVLRALRPIEGAQVLSCTTRGQYGQGTVGNRFVPGYLEESGVDDSRFTETFVALRADVENWRWAGVPFYLRTGKRMRERASEIIIQFKPVPHSLFDYSDSPLEANRLVLRLQPNEGIQLELMTKEPDIRSMRFQSLPLNLSFSDAFSGRAPTAYERLLMDIIDGKPTLFMRRDEVDAAWSWIEPILQGWVEHNYAPSLYPAGSWGPEAASTLLAQDGRQWTEALRCRS